MNRLDTFLDSDAMTVHMELRDSASRFLYSASAGIAGVNLVFFLLNLQVMRLKEHHSSGSFKIILHAVFLLVCIITCVSFGICCLA